MNSEKVNEIIQKLIDIGEDDLAEELEAAVAPDEDLDDDSDDEFEDSESDDSGDEDDDGALGSLSGDEEENSGKQKRSSEPLSRNSKSLVFDSLSRRAKEINDLDE